MAREGPTLPSQRSSVTIFVEDSREAREAS